MKNEEKGMKWMIYSVVVLYFLDHRVCPFAAFRAQRKALRVVEGDGVGNVPPRGSNVADH